MELQIGLSTAPDAAAAHRIAEGLVAEGWVACAQVHGPIESFYVWKGSLQRDTEWQIVLKFPAMHAKAVENWLCKEHPYTLPEWILLEAKSSEAYGRWVGNCCTKANLS